MVLEKMLKIKLFTTFLTTPYMANYFLLSREKLRFALVKKAK
jgi:hypothetical protein